MFNGHLDTSYAGDESWLTGPGYKPDPIIVDDAVVGLGIMNMKGAVACYVEAVRALRDAGFDDWISIEEASRTGPDGFRQAVAYVNQA